MTLPRIIGITGFARHGKDTVASVLVKELGYNRHALADQMKAAMLVLDPYIEDPETHDKAVMVGTGFIGLPVRLSVLVEALGWEGAKKEPEVRRLLQVFGTEVGRKMLGEDVWIGALAKSVKGFFSDQGPRVVIPDIRFQNEAAFIRRMRGEVWRVHRSNFDNGVGVTHASERDIPAIVPDERFINDLDEDYLKDQVYRYCKARLSFPVNA